MAGPSLQFEIALPIERDARIVMGWRNDPHTLEMSFDETPKVWEAFFPEFVESYFSLADLPPLFALHEGKRVAFLRFRPIEHPLQKRRKICEISLNVAPEHRGKGLGQAILVEINPWLIRQGYQDVYAEIKLQNEASLKAFAKAGYKPIGNADKKAAIARYLLQLSPDTSTKRVFIIAEAGSNWRMGTPARDRAMAFRLIERAAEAGADAIKFQTYRPETVYVKNAGKSDYLADAGIVEDIQDIFADLSMPYELIPELTKHCRQYGIEFMSTPFSKKDFEAVDPYVKRHKVASYEISHLRLIELAARSGKPLILSTGAATEGEISWAVNLFRANGGRDLTLLQCTAQYPAKAEAMNVSVIPWMAHRFQVPVGLSDHSRDPLTAPVAAVALGAQVIEKHFTLHNDLPGPDHAFAITADELKKLVQAIRQAELMLGSGVKTVLEAEGELRLFARRGIQAIRDIKKGEVLSEGVNIDILRPGKQPQGIHPRFITEMEGKKAKRAIALGSGVQFDDF